MASLNQIIADAIKQSVQQTKIVTLWNHDLEIPVGDPARAARDVLFSECEDYAETQGDGCIIHEFWGRDLDGAKWRVHVLVRVID